MGSADDGASRTRGPIVAIAFDHVPVTRTFERLSSTGSGRPVVPERTWVSDPQLNEESSLTDPRNILNVLRSREEEGQGLAEYALILALIAIVAILSMIFLGETIADLMDFIGSTIDASTL